MIINVSHNWLVTALATAVQDLLADVEADEQGRITEPFLDFDKGTPIEDVYQWYEDRFHTTIY